jgi:hypothetical protein
MKYSSEDTRKPHDGDQSRIVAGQQTAADAERRMEEDAIGSIQWMYPLAQM